MKTEFRSSFARDLKKLNDPQLLKRIQQLILLVEQADRLEQVPGTKKLVAQGDYFRIRLGDYRVGVKVAEDLVTFVRCLHRKDIYRYFP